MANMVKSKHTQDYGYLSTTQRVYIELKVNRSGGSPITITAPINAGTSYTAEQIWGLVLTAWNAHSWVIPAHSWVIPAPALTIDHTSYATTSLSSALEIEFMSIKIFFDSNNPRSLELPVILGFSDRMQSATGSIEIDNTYPSVGFYGTMPFMGSWRMQCVLDTEQGFDSAVSEWSPVVYMTDTNTDITRTTVSNGDRLVTRGHKFTVSPVPNKYVKSYDRFIDFASRGEITLVFGFDLFGDGTYDAFIQKEDSQGGELLFDFEQLVSYEVVVIPKSSLEV